MKESNRYSRHFHLFNPRSERMDMADRLVQVDGRRDRRLAKGANKWLHGEPRTGTMEDAPIVEESI